MQLNSIEEIIEEIRQGRPVILMDDEDRENEGDLIIAAEKITPDMVNFMISKARGLLCLTLTGERCEFLGLSQMVGSADNQSGYGTPFTVSIEAAEGVTTGISAQDRAKTIQAAVDSLSRPEHIVQPGHIFPLRAQPGGVLSRAGHTEAGCDLAKLAGLIPAAAIIEIMNDDGTMARRPDLEAFAETHGLKIGTIADLIHYRMLNEQTISRTEQRTLNTEYGRFDLTLYNDHVSGRQHVALTKGYISSDTPVTVRVHSVEPFRDLLAVKPEGSKPSWSLHQAMAQIEKDSTGVLVLLDTGESLDLGRALERMLGDQSRQGEGTSRAYQTVGTGSQILRDLGVGKMRLLSSPIKFAALSGFGLEVVEYLPYEA